MPKNRFASDRNGAVSVIFATAAVPMILLLGLAVDYGIWNQTNSALSVAANVAAMTAAKITSNAQLAGDPQAVTEGTDAGQQWFQSEVGSIPVSKQNPNDQVGITQLLLTPAGGANVNVTGGTTVVAKVSYSGTVGSIFGNTFGIGITAYPIAGEAVAQVTSAPYLDIEIMLDNSGSMEIGATDADIKQLQELTPCTRAKVGSSPPGARYITSYSTNAQTGAVTTNWSNGAGQSYDAYVISGYDGSVASPQVAPIPPLLTANYPNGVFPATGKDPGPSCQGATVSYTTPNYPPKDPSYTAYPMAGPPCAFACHWDTSVAAGTGNDFFALARSTIGTANPITLRFDNVKHATNLVISNMQTDNIPTINNLRVGLWTFDYSLHRVYPDSNTCPGTTYDGLSCEANNDFATAISDVGAPPTTANTADTGIQPSIDPNGGDTDITDSMSTLAGELTASGDGTTQATPRKVLFIVTDGLVDYPQPNSNGVGTTRVYKPIDPADCTNFKNLGYTIYVVFTPYYAVMNGFYISNIKQYAEPYATGSLATALQSCASSPSDYISASDSTDLDAALTTFLKAALTQPARFTM